MMVHSSSRRRSGAVIAVFSLALLLHAPLAHAARRVAAHAQTVSAPKRTPVSNRKSAKPSVRSAQTTVKRPANTVKTTGKVTGKSTRLTDADVERAGILASQRTDQDQAEKLDPSGRNAQVEDRVHAWMRTHHRDAASDDAKSSRPKTSTKPASKPTQTATETAPAKPAKSTGKATAADFDAAAAAQSRAPEPKGKPRSAVDMPGDELEAATQAASQSAADDSAAPVVRQSPPPARQITRAEAIRIANSPTPHVDLEKPAAVKKPASATAVVADSAREKRKTLDPEVAEKLTPKALKADPTNDLEAIAADELDDDEVPTGAPVSPLLRHDTRGRIIMPAALKGSHEILVHQNVMADRDGLTRIEDNDDLDRMSRARLLVPIPASAELSVNQGLPVNRRYARPWTARFLTDMARAHWARFHAPIQVNSAVRTVDFQRRLIRVNGNAAPPTGETASPHLTGQAIDLAKRGMSLTEIAWMRGYLLPLVQQGKIDVEEEFQQACFHISVYKAYMPQAVPKRSIKNKHTTPRMIAAGLN